ncbi:MAG: MFS transporter [Mycobacteriales bacterium]
MSSPAYRWVILAVGVAAQAAFSAVSTGLPSLAPALRAHYDLSIPEVGVALAAVGAGMILTMLAWGALADRIGERLVMSVGLAGAAAAMLAAARAGGSGQLVATLSVAGCFGASVNAASGRAVAGWFPPSERGLAMGVRQSALPLGGALAAATLPSIAGAEDAPRALAVLAGVCAVGAMTAAAGMRDPAPPPAAAGPATGPHPIRDARIWRLTAASFALVVPQLALLSFVALYLHDQRGLSPVAAGAVLAGAQVAGVAGRVAVGLGSDRLGIRLRLLRTLVTALAAALVIGVLLLHAPVAVTVAGLALAIVLALSWNGLAFLTVAETAAPSRRGVALGLQNTAVVIAGTLAPVGFGLTVAGAGWTAAFALLPLLPLLALAVLAPLVRAERAPAAR